MDAKRNAELDKLVNEFATRVASLISGHPMPDEDDGSKE
jgi:hypothetical protein